MNRREFLRNSGSLAALGLVMGPVSALARGLVESGSQLLPWQSGILDIHHINTGRGNSALAILPDGTSLLIDAGAATGNSLALNAQRPDASRRPGEWIARYVQRQLRATSATELDFALMTHLHGDHVGQLGVECPDAPEGKYKLTGISDVAATVPIAKLVDRGFPDYDFPEKVTDPNALNYIAFARSRQARGQAVEQVRPGSVTQIAPVHAGKGAGDCAVRILAGNGRVWSGVGETAAAHFPANPHPVPAENNCSIALRLSYGKFAYFTGGDLNCDTNYGEQPWLDIESAAAKVCGPVNVSTCDHHGYFDATGPEMVRSLRPRVWVLQSWHASHPALSTLANLYSRTLYPGDRNVFCTSLNPAASLADGRFSDGFKSSQGHVLVRVEPGGVRYSVLVLDDADESDRVKAVSGPFLS